MRWVGHGRKNLESSNGQAPREPRSRRLYVGETRGKSRIIGRHAWLLCDETSVTHQSHIAFLGPPVKYIGLSLLRSGKRTAARQVKKWVKSRCRRRKLLPRHDFWVVWARSTAVAVPPGKRNGWEHQDLRRRHLLMSEIENVPRTPISAVARPLEKHSTLVCAISSAVPSSFWPFPSSASCIWSRWRSDPQRGTDSVLNRFEGDVRLNLTTERRLLR